MRGESGDAKLPNNMHQSDAARRLGHARGDECSGSVGRLQYASVGNHSLSYDGCSGNASRSSQRIKRDRNVGASVWTAVCRGGQLFVSCQTLFALLQSADGNIDAATQFPIWAMADRIPRPGQFKEKLHWLAQYAALRKLDGVGILPRTLPVGYYPPVDKPPSAYPLLVHFRDIRDPKTVVRIDPTEVAASFGPGVKLRRITVQITDDAVTMGIKKRLRWLDNFYDKMLDGSPINNSQVLANNLSQMDFSAGASK